MYHGCGTSRGPSSLLQQTYKARAIIQSSDANCLINQLGFTRVYVGGVLYMTIPSK